MEWGYGIGITVAGVVLGFAVSNWRRWTKGEVFEVKLGEAFFRSIGEAAIDKSMSNRTAHNLKRVLERDSIIGYREVVSKMLRDRQCLDSINGRADISKTTRGEQKTEDDKLVDVGGVPVPFSTIKTMKVENGELVEVEMKCEDDSKQDDPKIVAKVDSLASLMFLFETEEEARAHCKEHLEPDVSKSKTEPCHKTKWISNITVDGLAIDAESVDSIVEFERVVLVSDHNKTTTYDKSNVDSISYTLSTVEEYNKLYKKGAK